MDKNFITILNQSFRIYFPYEEISIFMQGAGLKDKAIPAIAKRLGINDELSPIKLVFRSRHKKPNFPPDNITPLLKIKRAHPGVNYEKLKKLYDKQLLPKYLWLEYFQPKTISWEELLYLCNRLVEKSATEHDVFLRFSLMDHETLELITH